MKTFKLLANAFMTIFCLVFAVIDLKAFFATYSALSLFFAVFMGFFAYLNARSFSAALNTPKSQ